MADKPNANSIIVVHGIKHSVPLEDGGVPNSYCLRHNGTIIANPEK